MKANIVVIPLSCLVLAFAGSILAQGVKPAQQVKNWEPLVGHWVNEEQQRETADGAWQTVSSEWTIRMMPGGFFVDTPGKMRFADGREVSWVQVWGYDPVNEVAYQHWFDSIGGHGEGPYEFSGRVQKVGGRVTLADSTVQTVRCEWKLAVDYKSSEGNCERLTDGKWWTFRKVKGKKVN